jgi:hypothetical protein
MFKICFVWNTGINILHEDFIAALGGGREVSCVEQNYMPESVCETHNFQYPIRLKDDTSLLFLTFIALLPARLTLLPRSAFFLHCLFCDLPVHLLDLSFLLNMFIMAKYMQHKIYHYN